MVTPFAIDPQQRACSEELRALAAERLRPLAAAGEPGRVNRPLVAALGELGLLARLFPGTGSATAAGAGAGREGPLSWG
ncbi:hypothetical protein ACSNOH_34260, partial [Streptomyces sp. URMC 127]